MRYVELNGSPIDLALRRRGHAPSYLGDERWQRVLFPIEQLTGLDGNPVPRFLRVFGKPTFRKLARRLIHAGGEPVPLKVLEDIAGSKASSYLASWNFIEQGPAGVRLLRPLDNLGPTLEWYVAELCERELAGSAAWSVQLEGLPAGGDFDVLAWLDPTLLYVETKSAAPSEVTESELRNFLQRCEELAPDLAVLLVDSDKPRPLIERLNRP